MTESIGQEMAKSMNINDNLEYFDLASNPLPLRYVDFIDNKCRRNRFNNHKK